MAENKIKSNSRAVKAEAERQTDPDKPVLVREVTIEYNGEEYTVRQDALDDVEMLEAVEDERYVTVIRKVVGKDQWTKFKESVRTADGRVPTKPFEEFLSIVMESVGPTDAS